MFKKLFKIETISFGFKGFSKCGRILRSSYAKRMLGIQRFFKYISQRVSIKKLFGSCKTEGFNLQSVLKMRPHFEKFLCQADAWHTAVY
jgi:hypothetical protein